MLRCVCPAPLLLGLVGCSAGWQPILLPTTGDLPVYQQIQLWSGGQGIRLHAVRVTETNVSGVPFMEAGGCDSCRVTFPRAAVDSLRVGDPQGAFWATTVSIAALLFVWGAVTGRFGQGGT